MVSTKFLIQGTQIKANEESLVKMIFDPKKKTKVIIHGFIDTILASWVSKKVHPKFNKKKLYNVFFCDVIMYFPKWIMI